MKIDLSKNRSSSLGLKIVPGSIIAQGQARSVWDARGFVEGMDSTIPASRPAAYELDLSQASGVGGSAADVLKALSWRQIVQH